mmetsp:Transcript_50302/g.75144  ORF Transcript_50302/g.75144 Transcript_50302/m.75144 type:complete len:765 (-) Transcript_50302:187-2481(-)
MAKSKKDSKRSSKRKGSETNGNSNGTSNGNGHHKAASPKSSGFGAWLFPGIVAIVAIIYFNIPTGHTPAPPVQASGPPGTGGPIDDSIPLPKLLEGSVDRHKRIKQTDYDLATRLSEQGILAIQQNRLFDSLDLLTKAIAAAPSEPEGYNSLAGALRFLGRRDEAIDILFEGERNTIAAHGPNLQRLAVVKQGQYHLLSDVGRHEEAESAIQRACELQPTAANYANWAGMDHLTHTRKIELYTKAYDLDPNHYPAYCMRVHSYLFLPDWESAEADQAQLVAYQEKMLRESGKTRTDNTVCLQPFHSTYMNISSEILKQTSIWYGKKQAIVTEAEMLPRLDPAQVEPVYDAEGNRVRKLRIGYISSDLDQHPIGRNVAGLFMAHNKKRYEIFTFNTKKTENPITNLIAQHSNMVDISFIGDFGKVAKMIREEYKIDVLVDLNGWTQHRRLQVFGARPSPVQMTHGLGFVGTVGAESIDYFITDDVASPKRFDDQYTESVVRLPQAYLPASHKTVKITPPNFDPKTADKAMVRQNHELPVDDRFVFCSFQGINRISKEAFETWMRILQQVPDSIFWMTRPKPEQQENLMLRAKKMGIDVEKRMFFGGHLLPGENIVRSQACDLMLDSWPYNAHSTGMDTLWAGTPLLVYLPDYHDTMAPTQVPKMASRVSASLLDTMGLPQLIRPTIEDFEKEAIRLAKDPAAYKELRDELLEKRETTQLFDLKAYAVVHERAYEYAFDLFINGHKPQALDIPKFAPQQPAATKEG